MTAPNPFQPGGDPLMASTDPGSTNRGTCSLSFGDRVFQFRTNPNQVWWDYELITKVEQTYGGRVVQLLGTRLGDLTVTVECGAGGWPYLMSVVNFLRDMLSDQRNGTTATFEYTTRNWKCKVYALSIPFQDQVEAVARELTLTFKIQEDVTGIMSGTSLDVELARLADGVYRPGESVHNQYNDYAASDPTASITDALSQLTSLFGGGNTPQGYKQSGITNTVDANPLGQNPGGLNPFSALPGFPGFDFFGLF